MSEDFMPGFVKGIVTKHHPAGGGRVKALIHGIFEPETPYWIKPAGWPGAGGTTEGSQYPAPEVNAQIYILFEFGRYQTPESSAIYLTGFYGYDKEGVSVGPELVAQAGSAVRANKRTVIWEDASKRIYVVNEAAADDGGSFADSRIVLETRATNPTTGLEVVGAKIELNAADGVGEKAHTLYLEARTGIDIHSQGVINIESDTQVLIQGRKVSDLSDRGI